MRFCPNSKTEAKTFYQQSSLPSKLKTDLSFEISQNMEIKLAIYQIYV